MLWLVKILLERAALKHSFGSTSRMDLCKALALVSDVQKNTKSPKRAVFSAKIAYPPEYGFTGYSLPRSTWTLSGVVKQTYHEDSRSYEEQLVWVLSDAHGVVYESPNWERIRRRLLDAWDNENS